MGNTLGRWVLRPQSPSPPDGNPSVTNNAIEVSLPASPPLFIMPLKIPTSAMNASNAVNKIICRFKISHNLSAINTPNKYYSINKIRKYCSITGVWLVENAVLIVPSFTPPLGLSASPRLADSTIFFSFSSKVAFYLTALTHAKKETGVQLFVLRNCHR
jgi:hypothetical protein